MLLRLFTTTVTGPAAGTSTVLASGSIPGTVIVTSCIVSASTTIPANGATGTQQAITVPACANTMRFVVIGGAGGQTVDPYNGGHGGQLSGSIAVTPGQTVNAIAGGQGQTGAGGSSAYGNGGDAVTGNGGGRGGGAPALSLAGNLLIVAGGGGGGAISVGGGSTALRGNQHSAIGNAGSMGTSRFLVDQANTGTSGYYSVTRGGSSGTSSVVGAGGSYGGYEDNATNGNAGSGTRGGTGVATPGGGSGGSGGGGGSGVDGGGYRGGSGASLEWSYQGSVGIIPANGGGGLNYIQSGFTGVATATATAGAGQVVVVFSS